jgi:hypothetical protein
MRVGNRAVLEAGIALAAQIVVAAGTRQWEVPNCTTVGQFGAAETMNELRPLTLAGGAHSTDICYTSRYASSSWEPVG